MRIDPHIGRRALLRRRLLQRLAQFCEQLLLPRSGQVPLDRYQQVVAVRKWYMSPGLVRPASSAAASRVRAVMPCRSVTRTAACRIWILELGRIS